MNDGSIPSEVNSSSKFATSNLPEISGLKGAFN
jgi:hypothetical protein